MMRPTGESTRVTNQEAVVAQLPLCDICDHSDGPVYAEYDARLIYGGWANLCEGHFRRYTSGRLGVGYGQRLVVKEVK